MALNLRRRFDINFDIWQEGPVNGEPREKHFKIQQSFNPENPDSNKEKDYQVIILINWFLGCMDEYTSALH